MDGYRDSRRRKICSSCHDEFSSRHIKRHKCSASSTRKKIVLAENLLEVQEEKTIKKNVNIVKHFVSEIGNDSDFVAAHTENFSQSCSSSDSDEDFFDAENIEYFIEDEFTSDHEDNSFKDNICEGYIVVLVKVLLLWQSLFCISDLAFSYLFLIIKSILYLVSKISKFILDLYEKFPANINQVNKCISFAKDNFKKYIVCIKCFSLYNYLDCLQVVEEIKVSKPCNHVVFPNHYLAQFRKPCGEMLLKTIEINGQTKLVGKKIFCYKSLKENLQVFVNREGFEKKCETWRRRIVKDDVLSDIFDGDIWKDFNGKKYNFFTTERNYGVMLNVDWFQPFKHTNYSVGAIYLTVLNLPRSERFKKKNIILIGIIPDMKTEPPTNTFLKPLVSELQEAWNGIFMTSFESPNKSVRFRLALLCVGCDIPASRKLCGFLGHAATKGCNKCMKSFEGGVGEKNYGGFNSDEWEMRNSEDHRKIVNKIVSTKTKTHRENLEKTFGVRYSVLLNLEYFDPIRMTIIDPMHNLFLGTAKKMLHIWKEKEILKPEDFKKIESQVGKIVCPSDVGKLPQKIASCFGAFNADQFKNWTILFSVYALKGVIPNVHLEYWRKFVLACKILCTRSVSKSNVKVAHRLLISFCMKVEETFGVDSITPNMHMHVHLDKCLFDFGPVYAFWLFSFERENGVLGSIPTNKRDIELQIMRRFMKNSHTLDLFCNENLYESLGPEFGKLLTLQDKENDRGTLGEMTEGMDYSFAEMSSRNTRVETVDWIFRSLGAIKLSTLKNYVIPEEDLDRLKMMYNTLYPSTDEKTLNICSTCRMSKYVEISGSILGIKKSRCSRSSMIIAHWHQDDGNICSYESMELSARPGQIERILVHNILIDGKSCIHIIVKVKWFSKVDEDILNYYGKPVEVW